MSTSMSTWIDRHFPNVWTHVVRPVTDQLGICCSEEPPETHVELLELDPWLSVFPPPSKAKQAAAFRSQKLQPEDGPSLHESTGVQAFRLDGVWINGTLRIEIVGCTLTIESTGESITFSATASNSWRATLHGVEHSMDLKDDGKLHFNDGQIWTKEVAAQQQEPQKQLPADTDAPSGKLVETIAGTDHGPGIAPSGHAGPLQGGIATAEHAEEIHASPSDGSAFNELVDDMVNVARHDVETLPVLSPPRRRKPSWRKSPMAGTGDQHAVLTQIVAANAAANRASPLEEKAIPEVEQLEECRPTMDESVDYPGMQQNVA